MLDVGTPWRPVVPKMAPRIVQMVPKGDPKGCGLVTFWVSQNRLASKIAFGALLGTILVDFGSPVAPKSFIFIGFFDSC